MLTYQIGDPSIASPAPGPSQLRAASEGIDRPALARGAVECSAHRTVCHARAKIRAGPEGSDTGHLWHMLNPFPTPVPAQAPTA